VNRSASVRIDGVLAEEERAAASQRMTSFGAHLSSVCPHASTGRTYGLLTFADGTEVAALAGALGDARLHEPPLAIVEIVPDQKRRLAALSHALGGPGRPAGVVDAQVTADSLLLEVDASKTPLSLILDIIDCELETAPGRRIVPLIPLNDEMLAALARDLINDPAFDSSRLIETYTEPMLQTRST
jgi:hypothetical protein